MTGKRLSGSVVDFARGVLIFFAGLLPLVLKAEPSPKPFMRGMTVSCQTWGWEWATPQMGETLVDLKKMGVTWISLHPYAWISEDGSLRFENGSKLDYLRLGLKMADAQGFKVMLIPHIGYWGTKFLWRGEIAFNETGQWDKFFENYESWMNGLAVVAEEEGVDLFCVGLEYDHAQKFEQKWRNIIRRVRERYGGPLTYGSHHATYGDVRFWEALDYIGILSYEPLSQISDPSLDDLNKGWERWMARLGEFSRAQKRDVIFVEVGFNESAKAAAEPWAYATGGPNAGEIRLRCIESALRLENRYSFLAGMFFWKWFASMPGEREKQTFDMRDRAARTLIERYWSSPGKQNR